MRKNSFLLPLTILALYLLIAIIAFYTPLHSDDFPYSTMGLSLERHVQHYLTWSGRVVADYTSTLILSTQSHLFKALINSLGSALLIYNIALLPSAINKNRNHKKASFIAVVIFLLYWLSNPNIGQVMFWVVGSANYMWTSLLIIYFIRKNLEYREKKQDNLATLIFLFFIGILAGCTNENTCITLVLCMLAIAIYYRLAYGSCGKGIIISLISSGIGSLIMLLAPGNFMRASGASLEGWRNLSLLEKIHKHFYTVMPEVIGYIWLAIIVFIFSLVALLLDQEKKSKQMIYLAALMFMAFLLSNAVMVASPGYPLRAMNGQLIFLLCSLAVILYSNQKLFYFTVPVYLIVLIALFIPSYYSMFLAYKQTYLQSFVRSDLIKQAKLEGKAEVNIPSFYFLGLMKDGDKFDTYHSPYMAHYYGLKKINAMPAPFNYAVLSENYLLPLNLKIKDNLAKGIYAYDDKFRNESVFIIEFAKPANVPVSEDFRLFIKPVTEQGVVSKNTSLPMRTVKIGQRNFTYVRVKNVDFGSLKGINLGAYKTSSGAKIFTRDYAI